MAKKKYPYEDGDFTVIGPEAFSDKDETVICWKGRNYYADPNNEKLLEELQRRLELVEARGGGVVYVPITTPQPNFWDRPYSPYTHPQIWCDTNG